MRDKLCAYRWYSHLHERTRFPKRGTSRMFVIPIAFQNPFSRECDCDIFGVLLVFVRALLMRDRLTELYEARSLCNVNLPSARAVTSPPKKLALCFFCETGHCVERSTTTQNLGIIDLPLGFCVFCLGGAGFQQVSSNGRFSRKLGRSSQAYTDQVVCPGMGSSSCVVINKRPTDVYS